MVGSDFPLERLGSDLGIGGADSLVSILSVLFNLVNVGSFGIILTAVSGDNNLLCGGLRLVRNAERIGTHISDKTVGGLFADADALIELLRYEHRLLRAEAELSVCLLLKRGGDKGRCGTALLQCTLYACNPELIFPYGIENTVCLLLVVKLDLFAVFSEKSSLEHFAVGG